MRSEFLKNRKLDMLQSNHSIQFELSIEENEKLSIVQWFEVKVPGFSLGTQTRSARQGEG
jgi:hypothetical protein